MTSGDQRTREMERIGIYLLSVRFVGEVRWHIGGCANIPGDFSGSHAY